MHKDCSMSPEDYAFVEALILRWAYDTSGQPLPVLPRWLNEIK